MQVVDHDPYDWFLFRSDEGLFLDVNCNHSAVGYSVLIPLDSEESEGYAREEREFLDRLARSVQMAGPGSALQRRDVSPKFGEACNEAVELWRLKTDN